MNILFRDEFLKDEIQFKIVMPRWLSLVERVIRNLDVEGSNPSRGFFVIVLGI